LAEHSSRSPLLESTYFRQAFRSPRQVDCSLAPEEFFVSCPPRVVREHRLQEERDFGFVAFSSAPLSLPPQSAVKDRVREVLRLHCFIVSKRIASSSLPKSERLAWLTHNCQE
jgi:hypothetical protein